MKIYTIIAGVDGVGKSSLFGILSREVKNLGRTFITTLSGHRILNTVKRAMEKDYYIRLYYVGLNTVEESLVRIQNRVKKGGHNIPDADVKRGFDKRFEDLMTILPYCDEATFYDNENGFVAVAEYKNGEIIQVGSSRPQWLKELMEYVV